MNIEIFLLRAGEVAVHLEHQSSFKVVFLVIGRVVVDGGGLVVIIRHSSRAIRY